MDPSTARLENRFTALIGGSFDPLHNAHLFLARELLKDRQISEAVFMPVGKHNFKHPQTVLGYAQRRKLISQALEPGMQLWDDDETGSGFTSDLIRLLRIRHPEKDFAFVIGSDNLAQLPRWHDYEWLVHHLTFIVIPRPGFKTILPDPAPNCLIRDIHPPDISSSQIRARIAAGLPITELVPGHLENEIIKLYTEASKI